MKAKQLVAALLLGLLPGFATAGLDILDPGTPGESPGLVRDTGQNLIWLRDTNWAWNSGYQTGFMTWYEAMAWASQLSVTWNGTTYDDWRLPTVAEMSYLHDNYSANGLPIGTGFEDASDPENPVRHTDPGPFLVNQFIANQSADAWALDEDPATGFAYGMDMDAYFGAWLIDKAISGDNLTWGAVMVPEPETWVLLLAGAGLLGWRLRQKR